MFFDDCSTDKTYNIAKNLTNNDIRCKITTLKENRKKSWIFANLVDEHIADNDIVIFVDGDDWLANYNVLQQVSNYYTSYNPWVVYGGMVCWDGIHLTMAYPQNTMFPDHILLSREFRKDHWRSSHLKTMRGKIWKKINKQDFISSQDGKYILGPDDLIIMYAALEMCPIDKIKTFPFITYVYNASNQQRIYDHMHNSGKNYENEIRNRPKYKINYE